METSHVQLDLTDSAIHRDLGDIAAPVNCGTVDIIGAAKAIADREFRFYSGDPEWNCFKSGQKLGQRQHWQLQLSNGFRRIQQPNL